MRAYPLILALLLTAIVFPPNDAAVHAQWYGWGMGGYGGGFGGGTPASFETQAMADMDRSQGMFNQSTAAAMVDVERARSQYIENQKQWTELYMMRQQARQQQQAQAEQERRQRISNRDAQRRETPPSPGLVSTQVDPSTGEVHWPNALQAETFAMGRAELDALFLSRAHTGATADVSQAIFTKAREMRDELRKLIRVIPTQDYIEARRFLDGLANEGRSNLG